MRSLIAFGIALTFFAASAWWTWHGLSQLSPLESEEESLATTTPPVSQWVWEFSPLGEDAEGMPQTRVSLQNGGTSYSIGAFNGTCFDITQSAWVLLAEEGEFAGAMCWWAGGGSEIGVFSENGKAVVKIGEVEEGTAEESGIRGNFKTLFEISFGFITNISSSTISFDESLWLVGKNGEDAAIAAGLCTEETRIECLPNGFYIYNEIAESVTLPFAENVAIYMLTWHMEEKGVVREYIRRTDFIDLLLREEGHWKKIPYNVSIKDGEVIMIEEVYVP